MFTLEEINLAHNKVKSGEDFPKYIQEIKELGVIAFETWVKDSHTIYYGIKKFTIQSNEMYADKSIVSISKPESFKEYLTIHQSGKTDYFTFCEHCALTGIEKWIADLKLMTCTYFDKDQNVILVEKIPE